MAKLTYNFAEGFSLKYHSDVELASVMVLLSSFDTAVAYLVLAGYSVHRTYQKNIEVPVSPTQKEIFQVVELEAHRPSGCKLKQVSFEDSYNIPVSRVATMDMRDKYLHGGHRLRHVTTNNNYWLAENGQLPYGLGDDGPDEITFYGFEGVNTVLPAISIHTAPENPILSKVYDKCLLETRTSAVCYLTPYRNGWLFSEFGDILVVLSEASSEITQQNVSDEVMLYLRKQDRKFQFTVALVARAYRNKYKKLDATIFTSIILSPDSMAAAIEFDLSVVDNFF